MRFLVLSLIILLSGSIYSQSSDIIISYRKGACMGNCPVYSITVDEKGTLRYHGIMNVEKEGLFTTKLNDKEMKKLLCKFKMAKMDKLEDSYGMDIMDAPMTTFAYRDSTTQKIIMSKTDLPKKLMKAEIYLQSLTKDSKNKKIKWTEEKDPTTDLGRKEMAESMIIVQLNPGIEVENWIKKYASHGLKVNKKIAPNQEMYLLQYDHKTIQLSALIKKLKTDNDLASVEENKKVEMR